jgi:hydroxymethylbilane synthase
MKVIIGTRGSALARAQADITAAALRALDPETDVSIKLIQTRGDIDQSPIPLDQVGKGWFTKEIEKELLEGNIDIAVHSLKDMAEEIPEGLVIGAYLSRENPRDALVTKNGESFEALPAGAIVGTDSIRRKLQLLALRSDLTVKSIRGNVGTRLEKLKTEDYSAVVLAIAGLTRLGLAERAVHLFEPDEMTPAPGQGILALEVKQNDAKLQKLLAAINDSEAERAARIERSFSKTIGGGCKSPIGAYAFREGDDYVLIGMRADSESNIRREHVRAPVEASEQLGDVLAQKLLQD